MSRTKKFLYNSFSSVMLQLFTLVSGFILPKVILQSYGSEINGLVTSITQFISYFNLVEAGLASAAIYALYKPLSKNNHKKINAILSVAKRFYTTSGYIFLALVLGLAIIFPAFGKVSDLNYLDIAVLVVVLGLSGVLEFFAMSKYRVLLTADQKTYILSIGSILSITISTVITYVLAKFGVNITIVKFIALASVLVRAIYLHIYVKRKYNYVNYDEKPDFKALNKRWDALYLQILGSVQIGIPIILATILTDYNVVSIYSIYYMVIGGINSILNVFVNGLSASFGDIIARDEQDKLKKTSQEFEYVYYVILVFVYLVSYKMIMPFISIYTSGITDINYYYPIIGLLFILNGFLYNLKTPQGMLVISAGMYKETKKQTTLQALILVVFGFVFGLIGSKISYIYGLGGIMIGSILSNVYRSIDLLFFIPKYVTKLKFTKTLIRWGKMFLQIIIVISIYIIIDVSCNNYISWVKEAIKISLITIIPMLIIDLIVERQILKSLSNRVKWFLKGNKKNANI